MHAKTRKSLYIASLLSAPIAAALIATSWLAPVSESAVAPQAATPAPVSMVGEPTGELADGLPVYRLPAVTVSVKRSVELARIEQEDADARAALSAVLAARQQAQAAGTNGR